MVLRPDGWTHVAGRTTVVRVYPWLQFTERVSMPVAAKLYGSRDGAPLPGSPLSPVGPLSAFNSYRSLGDLRSNAAMSWNFVLPVSWTTAGRIDLSVAINPPGEGQVAECAPGVRVPAGSRCFGSTDNSAYLSVHFADVNQLTFRAILAQNHRVATTGSGVSTGVTATLFDLAAGLNWLWKVYPIPDNGFRVQSIQSVASECLGVTGDCNELRTAHLVGNADIARLGITSGSRTLIPIIVNPGSSRGCSGRAGIPYPLYWQGACGPTFAQETFHAGGGVNHSGNGHGEAAGGGVNPSYPGMHGQVESNAYGFDLLALQAIPPTDACDTGHTHDFMSYGCNPWVSLYTWQAIADWLGRAPVRAEEPAARGALVSAKPSLAALAAESLLVTGEVSSAGTVTISVPILVEAAPDPAGGFGPFRVELLGPSGEKLFSKAFEAEALLHSPAGTGQFTLLLPRLPGVVRIQLFRGDARLVELSAGSSLAAPNFVAASIPSDVPASGEVIIAWEAGPRGLTYTLEVGPGDEGAWVTLGRTDTAAMTVELASLPGDCSCRFRLQVSDGVAVAVAESGLFHTRARVPQPAILAPARGFARPGVPLRLVGIALGGSAGETTFEWLIDNAVVAAGATAEIAPLAEGRYHIVLRLSQGGLVAESAVDIEVAADSDGDGLPDEWERKYGLNPADPEDAALDTDGDNLLNWQELAYRTEPDSLDSDSDDYADDIEIAGGGDPTDANSLPHAIHGVEGLPVPKLSSGSRPLDWWWLYLLGGFSVAVAVAAWRWRGWWTRTATPPPDPPDNAGAH